MKKKLYLIPLLLLAVVLSSCQETPEAGKYDNWQARNEAFTDSLQQVYEAKTDPSLLAFHPMIDQRTTIFYKKKLANDTGAIPLYTSKVTVFYRGTYFTGEMFDENFTGQKPGSFDSPLTCIVDQFVVKGGVAGWTEVLQRMRVGERWLVYFPWQLCYGANNQTGDDGSFVPGCSSMIFDMQLTSIVEE
ncbi:MAG: FKBP-type peptidyl-prolyl cis-trans isomerase [Bacteroides sp.]